LYELYGSYRKVARELSISRNTAKKYVLRVKDVQEGTADEILPNGPRGLICPDAGNWRALGLERGRTR